MTAPSQSDKPGRVFAQHRCLPCGRGSWDELPDTTAYTLPMCCGKKMLPTGRMADAPLPECGALEDWSRQVRITIRGIDAQAERLTHKERTTFRDGDGQEPRDEDYEDIIHGYKLNTGLWHRLLGLLSSCPAKEGSAAPVSAIQPPEVQRELERLAKWHGRMAKVATDAVDIEFHEHAAKIARASVSTSGTIPRNMALVCATCRFPVNDDQLKACDSGEACPHKFGVVSAIGNSK